MGVLQLLGPDQATVLWDFADETGAANYSSVMTKLHTDFDLGTATVEHRLFPSPSRMGARYLGSDVGPVPMVIPFMADAATDSALWAGLGRLARDLLDINEEAPLFLKWTELADTYYFDIIGATNLPQLLDGRTVGGIVASRASSLGPRTLHLLRQPWMRGAERDPATNRWSNASMLADADRNGTPDGWTLDAGTHTIQTTEAFRIVHNAAADLIHRDFTAAAATQISVGIDARKVSGDRTVEIRLISLASAAVLATATVTGTAWTRYTLSGTVAGGDTSVRVSIRYTGGSTSTTAEFRDSQLETGTLTPSAFRTGAELITNDPAGTNGRTMVISNPGDFPTPVVLTAAAESGSPRIGSVLIGLRASDGEARRGLTSFLNETRFAQCDTSGNGWTRTLGTDTSSTADAAASGGNAAECTFSTNPTVMARRVKLTRVTLLDAGRGYHDVWVRLKPSAAMALVVQLRWAPSLADPASYSEPEVSLDWSDATSFSYIDVPLGTIYLPDDPAQTLAGLTLELWARRDTGSGNCRFDVTSLFGSDPIKDDWLSIVSVPGGSRESWLGKDLVASTSPGGLSAGTVINNRYRLGGVTQGAGTPPAAGIVWGTGRHKVTFRIGGHGAFDFTCAVRNITDSTDAVVRTFDTRKPSRVREVVLRFDGVAAKAYHAQVFTHASGGLDAGEYLDIRRIIHEVQPYVGSTEQIRTDHSRALMMKLDASGNLLSYLTAAGGVPLVIPPGRSVLEVMPTDIEVHSGATHGESVLARTLNVSPRFSPRYQA